MCYILYHIAFPDSYHLLGCLCNQVHYLYRGSPFDVNNFIAKMGHGTQSVCFSYHYGDVAIAFGGSYFPRIIYSRANHPWYENTALNNRFFF